jgi:hypothetical protein
MTDKEISYEEQVWNEAQMFARDVLGRDWRDVNWKDVPITVKQQFTRLIACPSPVADFWATNGWAGSKYP